MPTLYRKYRPQTFADIVSQDHIVQTIENEIATNKIAHAYLFSGPRGVGKTTLARLLAKAINCENRKDGNFEPCEECMSCQEITTGRNIDVIEIDAATHTQVDNVRENIIENAQFKPTRSKYKVFIIDEVHMLSASSFNALLKTLEEPPAHVIFILATTEFHKLPATVTSRCQRFGFKKIPYDLMKKKLEKICADEGVKVEKDVLSRIINKSDGALRDAESLLGQILTLNKKKITTDDVQMILPTSNAEVLLEFLGLLIAKNTAEAMKKIAALAEEGINWENFVHELTEVLRYIMLIKTGVDADNLAADYSTEHIKEMRRLSMLASPTEIVRLIEMLIQRRREIPEAPLPQLPLELLVVEWVTKSTETSPLIPSSLGGGGVSSPSPLKEERVGGEVSPSRLTQSIKNVISTITHHREPIKTELSVVQAAWNEIVDAIGATNPSLTFILRMAKIEKIDNAGLHLSFPYKLHKEKIEEAKNKKVIEECLRQKFSESIPLVGTVTEAATSAPADAELAALAVDFGGEVMN